MQHEAVRREERRQVTDDGFDVLVLEIGLPKEQRHPCSGSAAQCRKRPARGAESVEAHSSRCSWRYDHELAPRHGSQRDERWQHACVHCAAPVLPASTRFIDARFIDTHHHQQAAKTVSIKACELSSFDCLRASCKFGKTGVADLLQYFWNSRSENERQTTGARGGRARGRGGGRCSRRMSRARGRVHYKSEKPIRSLLLGLSSSRAYRHDRMLARGWIKS